MYKFLSDVSLFVILWLGPNLRHEPASKIFPLNSALFQELLSPEACSPVWYCSHWWGEPIRSFVQCCQQHAILRRLGALGSYWVCGYANRQHELDMDIGEDVSTTSFSEALSASRGLLLILDEKATPFSRWEWRSMKFQSGVPKRTPNDLYSNNMVTYGNYIDNSDNRW